MEASCYCYCCIMEEKKEAMLCIIVVVRWSVINFESKCLDMAGKYTVEANLAQSVQEEDGVESWYKFEHVVCKLDADMEAAQEWEDLEEMMAQLPTPLDTMSQEEDLVMELNPVNSYPLEEVDSEDEEEMGVIDAHVEDLERQCHETSEDDDVHGGFHPGDDELMELGDGEGVDGIWASAFDI